MTSKKQEKMSKSWLPVVLIVLLLGGVVTVGLLLGGLDGDGGSALRNNINESAINWQRYAEQEIQLSGTGKTSVNEPGVYVISGTLTDGMIEINTAGAVKLILDGVSITNNSGPAIYVAEATTIIIETAANSKNVLADASVYKGWDEDVCGTIFSHDDLVLQGTGTLTVSGNYEDGIVGKDDLKIVSGTYIVDAKDDGIRGRDSVYIVDGSFEITSGGDAIKANNADEVAKGWIKIDDGIIVAEAGDDGIHAESALEINDGSITVKKSHEGFEGSKITINGGEISIIAADDGINAAGGNDSSSPNMGKYRQSSSNYAIVINGGSIAVNSTGDGIDSNGALYVNGGVITVDGPTNDGNGALDSETGIIYNGGTIVAVGASGMAVAPNEASSKNSISVFFDSTYAAKTKIAVKDANGSTIISHTSAKTFRHATLSSEKFEEGETYYIYIDGVEYSSVTLNGKTTQLGSGGMNGMPSGGMMPPEDMPQGGGRSRF